MTKKTPLINYAIITVLCGLSILCGTAPVYSAQPFFPQSDISISALYGETAVKGFNRRMTWMVQCKQEQGTIVWRYSDSVRLFCTVSVDKNREPAVFILAERNGDSLGSALGGFLPVPGFPAPCQIFPDLSVTEDGSFKIIRIAGGRRFATSFAYSCEKVELKNAVQNGWLQANQQDYNREKAFFMVTITEISSQRILAKQLWQEASSWWLYQETDIGQFWRE